MEIPDHLKYTEEHEWVAVNGDVVVIGITDFAQKQLGDVVFVELPEVGDALESGKPFGVVESVKAVSDVYLPVSGEVLEVNSALPDQPELLNASPYENGWMVRIKLSDPAELDGLMDAAAYQALVDQK